MPPRRVVRAPKVDPLRLVEEFKAADALAKNASARAASLKEQLRAMVVEQGAEDDKGHVWLEIGDYQLKNEKRISNGFNNEAALEWCEEHGLREEVIEVVEQFDQDAFFKLVWEKKIPRKVADSFATESINWAFKVSGGPT